MHGKGYMKMVRKFNFSSLIQLKYIPPLPLKRKWEMVKK